MRIGVVTTSYPREPGDPAGNFVAGFARFLAARGHGVEVIAAGPGAAADGEIPVHRVHAGASLFYDEGAPDRLERRPASLAAAPVFAAALFAHAARRAPRWDRIVAHWLVPGVVAAPLRPTLAIAHSGDVHLAVRLGLTDAIAATLVVARSRVVFVAEHLRDRFLGAMRSRRLRARLAAATTVCPMGIEPLPRRDRTAARRRFGLPPGRPVVAFLGRLVPQKGVATLLRAVPEGAELLVAGAGPLAAELAAAAPSAHFTGELRGDARADLFAAADVCALPSIEIAGRTEGAPTVLFEAMAAGVPVVASDVAGARAACGDSALYAPPGDAEALRAALGRALRHPDEQVARGRERAAAATWSTIGERLLAEIVAGPSPLL